MTGPAIKVCGLGRRFGPVVALDGLDFGVAAGELPPPLVPVRRTNDD